MKKYFFPLTLSLVVGVSMAFYIIKQYDSFDGVLVMGDSKTLYFVNGGSYDSKENMDEGMNQFESYIYNVEDGIYYTYVGVSTSKGNAEKIQRYFKNLGFDTLIKERGVSNDEFFDIVKRYDSILSKTDDNESIRVICKQILAKYEEYVSGKYSN
ncbi:MAG: hypothetical protein IKF82_07640 [Bacilli bacterium]|nr:hypothetical protein [Bacilli bacterium]